MNDEFLAILDSLVTTVTSEQQDQEEISIAAQNLIETDPSKAAIAFWSHVRELDRDYVYRVASYICAKTANWNPPHLWVPVSEMISDTGIQDESTYLNLLTSLSNASESRDSDLLDIVSPFLPDFVVLSLGASLRVAEQAVDLVADLAELGVLQRLIYSEQAKGISEHIPPDIARAEKQLIRRLRNISSERPSLDELASLYLNKLKDISRSPLRGYSRISSKVKTSTVAAKRSLLNQLEALAHADKSKNTVQQIQLNGAEAARGHLRVEPFASLAREWNGGLRSYLAAVEPDAASDCEVLMLAPVTGSFVMQFMIESSDSNLINRTFRKLATILAEPESEVGIGTSDRLDYETAGHFERFLSTLDHARLGATLSSSDPHKLRTVRRRLSGYCIKRSVQYFKESRTAAQGERVVVVARLISGSLASNSFAIEYDGKTISGHFLASRCEIIIDKSIGRTYEFELQESTRRGESVWTLLDIRTIDTDGISKKAASRYQPDDAEIRTSDVPQQDRLDRIVSVVQEVAAHGYVTPEFLGMNDTASSHRHIGYMKQAARILGLLSHTGSVTQSGSEASKLKGDNLIRYLSFRFEQSKIFRHWSKLAGVSSVTELDGDKAVDFLRSLKLSESMAKRRGRTLKRWVTAFLSVSQYHSS